MSNKNNLVIEEQRQLAMLLKMFSNVIEAQMTAQGFDKTTKLEDIVLIHSELSEAVENIREGCVESDHIPFYTGEEEELADAIIRILHYAKKHNVNVINAIFAKWDYNLTRPFRHGKTC